MKAIEITEDQKEKLIEMCRSLFSEYELVFHDCQFDDLNREEIGFRVNGNIEIFHWFEFCYTHLLDKIFNSGKFPDEYYKTDPAFDSMNGRTDFSRKISWKKNFHPVDYLYGEFKNLK